MNYISWAACYEGPSDQAYFDVLIPRLFDDLIRKYGVRHVDYAAAPDVLLTRGNTHGVADNACGKTDAFSLIFFHTDTGGRSQKVTLNRRSMDYCLEMNEICAFPPERCITITPFRETETWVIADAQAVANALGYRGPAGNLDLPGTPAAAESVVDPKSVLNEAMRRVRGRRRGQNSARLYPAIAQSQDLDILRSLTSFADFERATRSALVDMGCVNP